jgi:sterol desaturase/sphingolipid hydroxylase (fatty acid hydroxylase superfamily)
MHRTHHSVDLREGNSNFAQVFTIWDRLFGTYVGHPNVAEAELRMGLSKETRPAEFRLAALLAYPFAGRRRN